MTDNEEIAGRLERIESLLRSILERGQAREWYSVEEFAEAVGKRPFTVREHCRHGRLNAEKKAGGRGHQPEWTISHDELLRFQRHGLLPIPARHAGESSPKTLATA
jgi:hypothetical protein